MDKNEAIYTFFNSLGASAYPVGNVPDVQELTYPYITYENVNGSLGRTATSSVSVWFKTNSERVMNAFINNIITKLDSGVNIACEGGSVFISCDGTWMSLLDVEDDNIKRKTATFEIMFNTF